MADTSKFKRVKPYEPVPMPAFGASVRSRRQALGLSQNRLAELMREQGRKKWHQNTVSRLEKGERSVITLGDASALESILGPITDSPAAELSNKAKRFFVAAKVDDARAEIRNLRTAIATLEKTLDEIEQLSGSDGSTS